jgi:hypothetical protein
MTKKKKRPPFTKITKYPTRQEILNTNVTVKTKTIRELKKWIKQIWPRTGTSKEKRIALVKLIRILNKIYDNDVKITFYKSSCHYVPKEHRINIDQSLSIVSTLHEYAHSLFGSSEVTACQWSVHVFKLIAPRSFNNLKWKGHMLIKK